MINTSWVWEENIQQKHPIKKLAYLEEYEDLDRARLREKQIQGWTREKKLKLINGEWINI